MSRKAPRFMALVRQLPPAAQRELLEFRRLLAGVPFEVHEGDHRLLGAEHWSASHLWFNGRVSGDCLVIDGSVKFAVINGDLRCRHFVQGANTVVFVVGRFEVEGLAYTALADNVTLAYTALADNVTFVFGPLRVGVFISGFTHCFHADRRVSYFGGNARAHVAGLLGERTVTHRRQPALARLHDTLFDWSRWRRLSVRARHELEAENAHERFAHASVKTEELIRRLAKGLEPLAPRRRRTK